MKISNGEQPEGLKSNWWYRLLRVIVITLYVPLLGGALFLMYDEHHPCSVLDLQKALIVCDDGKTYSLSRSAEVPAAELQVDISAGLVRKDKTRSAEARTVKGQEQTFTDVQPILSESEARTARSLCTYGQVTVPSVGLEIVDMPDGGRITGVLVPAVPIPPGAVLVPIPKGVKTSSSKVPAALMSDLRERYQRLGGHTYVQFQDLHEYTVKGGTKTEGSWPKTLAYMAVAWLVIHLALITLRGAVLYVAVGRFPPVSGLRGWLAL
jgi:hypothetical protein